MQPRAHGICFRCWECSRHWAGTFTESDDHRGSTVVMLTLERVPEAVCRRCEDCGPSDSPRRQALHGGRRAAFVVHLSRCRNPVVGSVSRPMPRRRCLQHHDWHQSQVVARLRPDVSLASAMAQVGAVQYQLHLQYPHDPVAEDVAPRSLNEDLAGNVKKPLNVDAERRRLHAADRLPQCREPAGCAGRGTAEGGGDSQRSRSAACHLDSRAD